MRPNIWMLCLSMLLLLSVCAWVIWLSNEGNLPQARGMAMPDRASYILHLSEEKTR